MKINCLNPAHKDANPSMHVYPERAYCFACGFSCPIEDLDLPEDKLRRFAREREDVNRTFEYIKNLPIKEHRGLTFPSDSEGYYIRFPGDTYYKKRLFRGNRRYVSPRGLRNTLLKFGENTGTLVLVEGEINLLSLKEAYPHTGACLASPGSAVNLPRFVHEYLTYDVIHAIVDYDEAGVINGLKLKERLLAKGKRMQLHAIAPDLNDILVTSGVDGVKKKIKEEGMEL